MNLSHKIEENPDSEKDLRTKKQIPVKKASKARTLYQAKSQNRNCSSNSSRVDSSSNNSIVAIKKFENDIDLWHRKVGLKGINQDCFANVAMQCLFCVPEFVLFFVYKEYLNFESKHNSESI